MTVFHLVTYSGADPRDLNESKHVLKGAWWKSTLGESWRAYVEGQCPTSSHCEEIKLLASLSGPNHTESGGYHYIVETDISKESEEEFNAWYDTEHLPGLARVPGTISAKRFLRTSGSPRYIACYELVSPAVMESKEWLAIRHTAWSSRIRPMFLNTVRELFVRTTN
jgi:hypothetical protein